MMTQPWRYRHSALLLLLIGLSACSSKSVPPEQSHTHALPELNELQPQVEFWRKVYSHWRLDQAVLHDNRHMNLIYAVIALPGPHSDHYSKAQRAYVRSRLKDLQTELHALADKSAFGEPLNFRDSELAELITQQVGRWAIWGAAERVRSQRGLRERFKRGIELSGRYLPQFEMIFQQAGLPKDLALLPHVESSFQTFARSSAGATGLWQFTRRAARVFAMQINAAIDERLDPIASAYGASRYLSTAYRELGSWPLALTSYNHGIAGMRRAQMQFGNDFPRIVREYQQRSFGFASRNFYAEFLAAREVARHPQRYFPEGLRRLPPLDWDHAVLDRALYLSELSTRYDTPASLLSTLNPSWRARVLRERLPVPAGARVWLPAGTLARLSERNHTLTSTLDTAAQQQETDVSYSPIELKE